jgi:hypothetical protein
MADVTNPQAITFANEQCRPIANHVVKLHYEMEQFIQAWTDWGMAELFPNDAESEVIDGSQTDGRPICTAQDMFRLRNNINTLLTATTAALTQFQVVATKPDGEE